MFTLLRRDPRLQLIEPIEHDIYLCQRSRRLAPKRVDTLTIVRLSGMRSKFLQRAFPTRVDAEATIGVPNARAAPAVT